MVLGGELFIRHQEAQGQAELVEGSILPADMNGQQALFEAVGFKFGAPVDGDPIFVHATLPPGWRIEATDHAMWSRIVDAKGRERAVVFYKAAFYDRRADMRLTPRCTDKRDRVKGDYRAVRVAIVDGATGEELWHTDAPSEETEAALWSRLDAERPGWRDLAAPWDDEEAEQRAAWATGAEGR
jgi:hypothetical protein